MRNFCKTLALALVLCGACAALASPGAGSLASRVKEHRLGNGMMVLVLPKPGAPVVSLQMTYHAGAVDEPSGRTGMAHMLEHMMFKGTRRLGTVDWKAEGPILDEIERVGGSLDEERRKGGKADPQKVEALDKELSALEEKEHPLVVPSEIDRLYSENGAVGFNASTSTDLTNYVVSLPSNRLELWAAIESERMREPVLREYYTERAVVGEERRQRSETDPGGVLMQALLSTAFAAHPYRNPVIGWPSDLDHLDINATRDFFTKHYGPDSVVVAAVGDVDPEAFFALMERYFGALTPGGGKFDPPTTEPVQNGPRRVEVYFDAEPEGALAYHKPTLPERDDYVFDVIDSVLSDGRTSRLWTDLVEKRKIATSVGTAAGLPGARYPNLFTVFVTPAKGVDVETCLDAAREVLTGLSKDPPTEAELAKVRTRLEADRVRALVSDSALAARLAYFQSVAGDWRYIEKHPEVLATITSEEVAKTAAKYFTREGETVAVLKKEVK